MIFITPVESISLTFLFRFVAIKPLRMNSHGRRKIIFIIIAARGCVRVLAQYYAATAFGETRL